LEQYYSSVYPKEADSYGQPLAPTFQKPVWQPGEQGHFNYPIGDDHLPMVMTGRIKKGMQEIFQRDDDAVYYMNQVRCLIEKQEDLAQSANDFTQGPSAGSTQTDPQTLPELLTKISGYFGKPEYQLVLVDDVNAANMDNGQPRGRTNQMTAPTPAELKAMSHSSPGVANRNKDTGHISAST
jgi:hypothetical protein